MDRGSNSQIAAAPDFELTTPANLALLTFRYPPGLDDQALDTLNERLLHALSDSGRIYLTQTHVRGRCVIRFAIGQRTTEPRHVQGAWDRIKETARGLSDPGRAVCRIRVGSDPGRNELSNARSARF